jgi:hypothetical protein
MLSCQHAFLLDIDLSLPGVKVEDFQSWRTENFVPSFSLYRWYGAIYYFSGNVELDKEINQAESK